MSYKTNKKVKQWIDKKKSRTYTLISRNVDVQGAIDDHVPNTNEMVLKKIGGKVVEGQFDDIDENDDKRDSQDEGEDVEEVDENQKYEYVDDFDREEVDDDLIEDGYDYRKHIKSIGGGVFVTKEGQVGGAIKDPVKNMNQFEDIDDIDELKEIDPEIVDAMKNTDQYDELDDNFVVQANISDEEDEIGGNEKEDFTKYDFGIDENDDDEEYDMKGKSSEVYIPRHPEKEQKTLDDELFEHELKEFGDVEDESSSDVEHIPGMISNDDFGRYLNDCLQENKKEKYIPVQNINHVIINLEKNQLEHEEEMDIIYVKQEPQWDAETILSTWSNTENHPKLIAITDDDKRIRFNERGLPMTKEEIQEKIKQEKIEEEKAQELRQKENLGKGRNKNETPEEKKQRKKETKQLQKEKKLLKKQLKLDYQQEALRQKNMNNGMVNKTIIQY